MSRRPAPHDAVDARRPSERGAALVFALFGLATLTVLGLGLTSMGMMATKMTSNERDTQQAIALADAGLAHARKLITFQEWDSPNMTPFLIGGDAVACNGDELSQAPPVPALPAGYPTLFIQSAAAGGQAFGAGSYRVYVCDDHLTDVDPDTIILDVNPNADVNKRILVRSVGTTANGATASVEQVFAANTVPALLVNGPLSVRGDVDVTGSGGIIHANGTMDIVGNSVCAEQYFSSAQQITGGIPEGGAGCDEDGEVRPGSAPINIRQIYPSNYRWRADYWLTTVILPNGPGGSLRVNGQVRQNLSANHPALSDADFTPIPTPAGWTFSDNRYEWTTNGGSAVAMPQGHLLRDDQRQPWRQRRRDDATRPCARPGKPRDDARHDHPRRRVGQDWRRRPSDRQAERADHRPDDHGRGHRHRRRRQRRLWRRRLSRGPVLRPPPDRDVGHAGRQRPGRRPQPGRHDLSDSRSPRCQRDQPRAPGVRLHEDLGQSHHHV